MLPIIPCASCRRFIDMSEKTPDQVRGYRWKMKRGRPCYCGMECAARSRRRPRKPYTRKIFDEHPCPVCRKPTRYLHCSHGCRAAARREKLLEELSRHARF